MLSIDDVKENVNNYYTQEKKVFSKKDNKLVVDEQKILEVKSSILIYNRARINYKEMQRNVGKDRLLQTDPDYYIKKEMERLGVNDQINSWGTNKLIRSLIDLEGSYREAIGSNELNNTKFDLFSGNQKDYGLAYLRLKLREKGMDLENFSINLDTTEFKQNGYSEIIIDLKKKTKQNENSYAYSQSDKLNELERKKQEAIQANDKNKAQYYQNNIRSVLRSNPIVVSPEQWDRMDTEEKLKYYRLKMKEAKTFNDRVSFEYWNANSQSLQQQHELDQMLGDSNNQTTNKKDSYK